MRAAVNLLAVLVGALFREQGCDLIVVGGALPVNWDEVRRLAALRQTSDGKRGPDLTSRK